MAALFGAVLLAASLRSAAAVDGSCYELVSAARPDLFHRVGSRPEWVAGLRKGIDEARLTLGAPIVEDAAFKLCGLCTTPDLVQWLDPAGEQLCRDMSFPQRDAVDDAIVAALIKFGGLQGHFWNDPTAATSAWRHLIAHAPRRDFILLFNSPSDYVDFAAEHIRLAMRAWATNSQRWGVSWELWLDYVLPYSMLDEKRDVGFHWRSRFATLLSSAVAGAATVTDAMHILADTVPNMAPLGVYALTNGPSFQYGLPITWHSETSPEMISPEQVSQFGGSCTGTAIVLVAAARSVGIPARMAGCSETNVKDDDHHWIEFWDGSNAGPFGDFWHTREGVSAGASDGPWDSPSAPMSGCLQGVVPGSPIDTLWVSVWSSDVNAPTLWAETTADEAWSRVGGVNVCGRYCTAWGCGAGNAQHWSQAECFAG